MAGLFTKIVSVPTLAWVPGGWELALFAGIVLLLFGNRLPGAAKSLGQSFSAFKKGVKEGEDELNELSEDDQQKFSQNENGGDRSSKKDQETVGSNS